VPLSPHAGAGLCRQKLTQTDPRPVSWSTWVSRSGSTWLPIPTVASRPGYLARLAPEQRTARRTALSSEFYRA